MKSQPNPLQMLAALVIDFFRWSQMTPMILMWALMLGMLFALFFVGNQEATWSIVQRGMEWVASLPVIGPKFVSWMESQSQDGAADLNLGTMDFKSAVLTAWAVISGVFMALGWLAGLVFGPFKPWTLKRKLGVITLASILVVVTFMGLYFLDRESWNNPSAAVLFTASGMAFILFLVSAWCITVSHALGRLFGLVAEADFSQPKSSDGII